MSLGDHDVPAGSPLGIEDEKMLTQPNRSKDETLDASRSAAEASEPAAEASEPAAEATEPAWKSEENIDFFLPPALTLDTLSYIEYNGEGPGAAFNRVFGSKSSQRVGPQAHSPSVIRHRRDGPASD